MRGREAARAGQTAVCRGSRYLPRTVFDVYFLLGLRGRPVTRVLPARVESKNALGVEFSSKLTLGSEAGLVCPFAKQLGWTR